MSNLLGSLIIRDDLHLLGPYIAGTVAAVLAFLLLHARSSRRNFKLPPGPQPLPVIGNLLDFPKEQEWLGFQKHTEQYGDLVYLSALGRKFLFLGSEQAINDVIEKRAHFNDRPHFTMLNDLMNMGWNMTLLPYAEHWRRSRRLLHTHTHPGAAPEYQPVQLEGARQLIVDLLTAEPTRPSDKLGEAAKAALPRAIQTNFGVTAMRMIYGIQIRGSDMMNQFLSAPEAVNHAVNESASPGRYLVDFFPWMRHIPGWFPGANFRRYGVEIASLNQKMRNDAFDAMKTQTESEMTHTSMAAQMLDSALGDEQLVKDVAGVFYLAAYDTTVAAVTSHFLAALVYPEVQMRAQEELDRVVGRGRLPEYSDKPDLPYVDGVMRECLRWLPVVPLGVPHASTRDDEYRGYFIPKGTMAIPLQWSLCHDPERFPNPSTFMPERYLQRNVDSSWSLQPDAPDPRKYVFGFGRRICPGMHIAEQSLFAIVATVLHTIQVERVKDASGVEVVPEVLVNSGTLSHALPFPYCLRMRDDAQTLVDACRSSPTEM